MSLKKRHPFYINISDTKIKAKQNVPTPPPPQNPNPPTPNTPPNTSTNPMFVTDATDGLGSRFYIAVALIVGMLIILIISVAESQFTQTTQLAAIFSGWITSIVAFYFYGQTNAQNQTQIKNTTQAAANSEQRAIQAERKISNIKSMVAVHAAIQKNAVPTTTNLSDEVLKNINELLQKD